MHKTDKTDDSFGLSERDLYTCRKILCAHPSVLRVFIFGSRAKGTGHSGSDIDLAVMNPVGESILRKIKAEFDSSSLPYTVDLVDYTTCSHLDLKDHINRAGRLFFKRSEKPIPSPGQNTLP